MSQPKALTKDQVVSLLRTEVKRVGSQAAFARAWRINQGYLSEVLGGTREPGPAILTVLKLVEHKLFVPVEDA